jgi:hypothetical protein
LMGRIEEGEARGMRAMAGGGVAVVLGRGGRKETGLTRGPRRSAGGRERKRRGREVGPRVG